MNSPKDMTHVPNQATSSGTYTINQLAELLNCSVRHARRLDAERSVPGRLTFGRLVQYSRRNEQSGSRPKGLTLLTTL